MSRQMNRFCLEHLLPSGFRAEPLPVLYNSWEATEFNVNVALGNKGQMRGEFGNIKWKVVTTYDILIRIKKYFC